MKSSKLYLQHRGNIYTDAEANAQMNLNCCSQKHHKKYYKSVQNKSLCLHNMCVYCI